MPLPILIIASPKGDLENKKKTAGLLVRTCCLFGIDAVPENIENDNIYFEYMTFISLRIFRKSMIVVKRNKNFPTR